MTAADAGVRRVGIGRTAAAAIRQLGPDRKLLPLLCTFSLASGLLETVLLFAIARLAIALTSGEDTVAIAFGPVHGDFSISETVSYSLVVLVVLVLLAVPTTRLSARLSETTIVRLRTRLLHAYLASSWSHRSMEPEGSLQHALIDHTARVERLVQQFTLMVVAAGSVAMIAVGAVLSAPLAALIALIGLVIAGSVFRPFNRLVRRQSERHAAKNRELASWVSQAARLGQEVSAFDVSEPVGARLERNVRASAAELKRLRRTTAMIPSMYQYLALALVLVVVAVLNGIDPEQLVATGPVVLLLVRALGYGRQLQAAVQAGNELTPYVDRLDGEIAALLAHELDRGSVELDRLEQIEVVDVSFEYIPDSPVLIHTNFHIEPGETIGIVGPSGGGKSSLVQLLMRLREPTSGHITVGGRSLSDVEASSWAALAALVPQDNKLFLGTVADNIRFFRPELSDADVDRAARLAHLHDEITALPDGFDTIVGPGARELSGGQRQRLGIARALAARPQLLVMDEPTSALDARSEQLIRQTMEELRGSTTMVVVAHRPATLEVCDRVLHVEHGRVELKSVQPRAIPAEVLA